MSVHYHVVATGMQFPGSLGIGQYCDSYILDFIQSTSFPELYRRIMTVCDEEQVILDIRRKQLDLRARHIVRIVSCHQQTRAGGCAVKLQHPKVLDIRALKRGHIRRGFCRRLRPDRIEIQTNIYLTLLVSRERILSASDREHSKHHQYKSNLSFHNQ